MYEIYKRVLYIFNVTYILNISNETKEGKVMYNRGKEQIG